MHWPICGRRRKKCKDSVRFYERVLGGKIRFMMTYGESPVADQMPPEFADGIMNAQLDLPGGGLLYAGDRPSNTPYEGIRGVCLTLNFDSIDEAEKVFAALSEGGKVTMPMEPTFWAKRFGMLDDKFGTPWIINGELCPLGPGNQTE